MGLVLETGHGNGPPDKFFHYNFIPRCFVQTKHKKESTATTSWNLSLSRSRCCQRESITASAVGRSFVVSRQMHQNLLKTNQIKMFSMMTILCVYKVFIFLKHLFRVLYVVCWGALFILIRTEITQSVGTDLDRQYIITSGISCFIVLHALMKTEPDLSYLRNIQYKWWFISYVRVFIHRAEIRKSSVELKHKPSPFVLIWFYKGGLIAMSVLFYGRDVRRRNRRYLISITTANITFLR